MVAVGHQRLKSTSHRWPCDIVCSGGPAMASRLYSFHPARLIAFISLGLVKSAVCGEMLPIIALILPLKLRWLVTSYDMKVDASVKR